jgi:hypothetical protein
LPAASAAVTPRRDPPIMRRIVAFVLSTAALTGVLATTAGVALADNPQPNATCCRH